MRIQAKLTYDLEAYKELFRLNMKKSLKIINVVFCVLYIIMRAIQISHIGYYFVPLDVVPFCLLLLIVFFSYGLPSLSYRRERKLMRRESFILFSDDRMDINMNGEGVSEQAKYTYESLMRAVETPTHLFLYPQVANGAFILKKADIMPDDLFMLRSKLQSVLQNKYIFKK